MLLTVGTDVVQVDWREWRDQDRVGVWREIGIVEAVPDTGLKVVWRAPLPARVFLADIASQNVAIGLSGDPVPPGTANGAAVNRNSHRPCAAAASATASRRQLSKRWMPNTTSAKS